MQPITPSPLTTRRTDAAPAILDRSPTVRAMRKGTSEGSTGAGSGHGAADSRVRSKRPWCSRSPAKPDAGRCRRRPVRPGGEKGMAAVAQRLHGQLNAPRHCELRCSARHGFARSDADARRCLSLGRRSRLRTAAIVRAAPTDQLESVAAARSQPASRAHLEGGGETSNELGCARRSVVANSSDCFDRPGRSSHLGTGSSEDSGSRPSKPCDTDVSAGTD